MQQSHVSTEQTQVSKSIFEDESLPTPEQVEAVFNETQVDDEAAADWLADFDIDINAVARACGKVGLINYAITWDRHTGCYRFRTFPTGYRQRIALAVPVLEAGQFVDLLLIGAHSFSITTACGRARWLGRDNLAGPVVRLHAAPFEWLEADCEGVCHVHPYSRQALKELRAAQSIACNDIETALEAAEWMAEWGTYGESGRGTDPLRFEDAMARFEIDAPAENILAYLAERAAFGAASVGGSR